VFEVDAMAGGGVALHMAAEAAEHERAALIGMAERALEDQKACHVTVEFAEGHHRHDGTGRASGRRRSSATRA
jgi:hypothetical protein